MDAFYQLSPLPSGLFLLLAVMSILAVLYLLRPLSHRFITGLSQSLYALLRLGSQILRSAGSGLWRHSRELVLAQTRQQLAHSTARNFRRLGQFVERGLGGYPSLEHRISQQVGRLEEDYQHCTLVPPPPPDWLNTVESVVNLRLKASHQPLVEKMLEDIHLMAEEQQRENLRHYRQSMGERHALLKRVLPAWRRLSDRIDRLGRQLREITQRAHAIDSQMTRLEQLEQSDRALDMRSQLSRFGYFAIAAGALALLAIAAVVNYQLLLAPLQQALASTPGAELSLASFSAGLWLGLQMLLGLVILELLQVTRLLPAIGQLTPTVRHIGTALCVSLLLTLAALGAFLVWSSGFWAAVDNLGAAERNSASLALLLSSCLAFILPLLLVLSAIPLEQCIDNVRPLVGYALGGLLMACAAALYLLGVAFRRSGPLLVLVYDALISIPLLLERYWHQGQRDTERKFLLRPSARIAEQHSKAA